MQIGSSMTHRCRCWPTTLPSPEARLTSSADGASTNRCGPLLEQTSHTRTLSPVYSHAFVRLHEHAALKSMLPASGTLLIRNATVLATMDLNGREIRNGGMFIRDGWIEQVDVTEQLPVSADRVVDLSGHLVMPGFVNGHHHLYQTLDRACPASQNVALVDWLFGLYPRWARLGPDDVALATEIGLIELALSGCTTAADHHYIWPSGVRADKQFEIARRFGLRFHLG